MASQRNGRILDSSSLQEEPPIDQLRKKVKELTVTAVGDYQYVRVESLKAWMKSGILPALIREVFHDRNFPPDTQSDIREYLVVFAILLTLETSRFGLFIEHFKTHGLSDARLPIPKSDITQLHDHADVRGTFEKSEVEELATQFFALQWRFWPMRFELNMHTDVRTSRIIPICRKQLIKRGGSAKVWQILVQEEFVDERLREAVANNPHGPCPDTPFGPCYQFALKTFDQDKIEDYKDEKHAFDGLREHDGMIRCLGSFTNKIAVKEESMHSNDQEGGLRWNYNILLEYSELDLKDVFGKRLPPVFPDEIMRTWEALLKIAEAVDKLHNLELEKDGKLTGAYFGWHADIKPSNILSVEGQYRLADPGFARFEKQDNFTGQDLPRTVLSGGTETYAAPERLNERNAVSQRVDTWSLGCVLSLAATWIVLGYSGITQYKRVRCDALKAARLLAARKKLDDPGYKHPLLEHISQSQNELDLFHNGREVLKEITDWHATLRASARRTDNTTPAILDVVDRYMLVGTESKRSRAKDVCKALENALKNHPPVVMPDQTKQIVEKLRDFDSALPDDPAPRSTTESPEHSKKARNDGLLSIIPENMRTSHRSEHLGIKVAEHLQDEVKAKHIKVRSKDEAVNIKPPSHDMIENRKHHFLKVERLRTSTLELNATNDRKPPSQNVIQAYYSSKQCSWKGRDPALGKYFANRDRDIVFLVDNATTMAPYWEDATFLLHMIEQKIHGYDSDGLDLRFTQTNPGVSHSKGRSRFEKHSKLQKAMQDAVPKKTAMAIETHMGMSLANVFNEYLDPHKPPPSRKFTLIVLTDGRWEAMKDKDEVRTKIKSFMQKCNDVWTSRTAAFAPKPGALKLRPVSIQFIQFGQDLDAFLRLRHLDNELEFDEDFAEIGDVVDHEMFEIRGNIYKMILGSFEPNYDAIDTDAEVAATINRDSISRDVRKSSSMSRDDSSGESLGRRISNTAIKPGLRMLKK